MQLGLAADTERVHIAAPGSAKWEAGKGRDLAKQLLTHKSAPSVTNTSGRRTPGPHLHQRAGSFHNGDRAANEEESDDGSDAEVSERRGLIR